MKRNRKIIFAILLIISIASMFLPIASFHDNSANSLSADIEKQQSRVESAQKQLDRWIEGGKKSEADIEKQKAKVQKEQEKLAAPMMQIRSSWSPW